jgi:hypothetical protein
VQLRFSTEIYRVEDWIARSLQLRAIPDFGNTIAGNDRPQVVRESAGLTELEPGALVGAILL